MAARKSTGPRESRSKRKPAAVRTSTSKKKSTAAGKSTTSKKGTGARKSTASRRSTTNKKPVKSSNTGATKKAAAPRGASPAKPDETARGKQKRSRGSCFVISPFGGWFDTYYEDIYKPAVEAAGMSACRADDLYRPSSIVNDIWSFVTGARVLIADLTGKNPNVLYELGLAHAIGKPVILLTQDINDVPFDLRALRVLEYDVNDPSWSASLREKIATAIGEVLASPQQAVPATFLKAKKTKSPSVTPQEKRIRELEQQVGSLRARQTTSPVRAGVVPETRMVVPSGSYVLPSAILPLRGAAQAAPKVSYRLVADRDDSG